MFVLVDCNNFFASCEEVFNPKLKRYPLVILSNNDGCVIARSQKAKALGIPMGAPAFKYREFFVKHNVQALSSNFSLYSDMSQRVVYLLEELGFPLEVYSIDESFIKLPPNFLHIEDLGLSIKNRILQCLGISVSVGIAPTKTLAKVANRLAKKNPLSNGIVIFHDSEKAEIHLKNFPIEDIWGVGRSTASFLREEGIFTAHQLSKQPDAWVKKHLKVTGLRTVWELRGISCHTCEEEPSSQKGLISSRSFSHDVYSLEELKEAIAYFASKACYKLRKQDSVTNHLMVFIAPSRFSSFASLARSAYYKLPFPTDSSITVIKHTHRLVESLYAENTPYKKAGIGLFDLTSKESIQIDLFEAVENEKMTAAMKAMDSINTKAKKRSIFLGAEGLNKPWLPRPANISPSYTTNWKDIPQAT